MPSQSYPLIVALGIYFLNVLCSLVFAYIFHIEELNWTRPHNDFLWIGSEKGFPGLILYLSLFVIMLFNLIRIIVRSEKKNHKRMALLFFGAIISYMVMAFFSFPYERTEHQLYIAFMAGISIAMIPENKQRPQNHLTGISAWVLIILFSVSTLIIGSAAVSHESHIRKAIEAQNKRNWTEVLRESKEGKNPLTSLDPYSLPAEYYSGLAHARMNKHTEAIQYLEQALKFTPNNIWIQNLLGQSYFQIKKYDKAQTCVEKVLKVMPADETALKSLSAIYFFKEKYHLAIRTLHRIPEWQHDQTIINNINALKVKIEEQNMKAKKKGQL